MITAFEQDPAKLLDRLTEAFPLIEQMAETPQDARWHAEGNVRIHTERVIAETYRVLETASLSEDERLALILGAALHDIGKTLTTREAEIEGERRIVSPHHTERGRSYLAPRMPLLGLPWNVCDLVLAIVGRHHDPKKLVRRNAPLSAYWRLSRAISARMVYLFELADLRGRDMDGEDARENFDTLELFRLGAEEAGVWDQPEPYAAWREQLAQVLSGPALDYVFHEAIRQYEAGEIHTPEEAVARTYPYRDDHPEVTVTCAPSGSGKSSWVESLGPEWHRISLDEIREEMLGKRADQSRNGEVVQRAKELLREHLRARRKIVWDATSLRTDLRGIVLDLARDYHAATRIAAFACPPDWVASRNKTRAHPVRGSVIQEQYERLQWPEVWEVHVVETIVAEK